MRVRKKCKWRRKRTKKNGKNNDSKWKRLARTRTAWQMDQLCEFVILCCVRMRSASNAISINIQLKFKFFAHPYFNQNGKPEIITNLADQARTESPWIYGISNSHSSDSFFSLSRRFRLLECAAIKRIWNFICSFLLANFFFVLFLLYALCLLDYSGCVVSAWIDCDLSGVRFICDSHFIIFLL